jgi:HlyD family secretion protein
MVLQGVVKSIAPLPYQERKSETGNTDVTYFQGVVQLSTAPEGLKPGMTAELEIKTGDREGVPVVPHAAVTFKEGRHVCRVVHRDGPEAKVEVRPVTLGESNLDMQEITEGVAEGEEVMLDTSVAEPPSRLGAAVAWFWK